MRAADLAMYREKLSGRQRYRFYQASPVAESEKSKAVETILKRPLDFRQFELYFQRRHRIADGQYSGLAMNVLWNHPSLGLLRPDVFLDSLEEYHLTTRLFTWTLESLSERIDSWRSRGEKVGRISLHITASQFTEQTLDVVGELVKRADPPLELTVDEKDLQVLESHLKALNVLKLGGLTIAVDRFGRFGFPLVHLARLPVDALIIDGELVKNIGRCPAGEASIRGGIAFGHALHLRVVADGVESEEQLVFLNGEHCDEAQGPAFGEALPADRLSLRQNEC